MEYDGGLLALIERSGALAAPVLLLLVVAIALVVTIGLRLHRAIRHNDEALQRVELLGRQDRRADAVRVAAETPGAAARVMAAGLAAPTDATTDGHADSGADAAERAMAAAASAERARLRAGARLLDWTGALAVLVPGAALVLGDRPDAALAGLALGLGVAVAVSLARWAIVAAVRRASLDMERAAGVTLDFLGDDAASR